MNRSSPDCKAFHCSSSFHFLLLALDILIGESSSSFMGDSGKDQRTSRIEASRKFYNLEGSFIDNLDYFVMFEQPRKRELWEFSIDFY